MIPAYVLHRYRHGETSVLLKLFTREQGLVPVIARGARRAKSPWRALVQPFIPLKSEFVGRGAVKTLKLLESAAPHFVFDHQAMACGLYMNELILTLVPEKEPNIALFDAYTDALAGLMQHDLAPSLRQFERTLLLSLGVSPPLKHDEQMNTIEEGSYYDLRPDLLPIKTSQSLGETIYPGSCLQKIDSGDFSCKDAAHYAKRLFRQWLDYYGHGRVMKSRELLRGTYEQG